MQNSDGGWAAYDRDINNQVLTRVTFADHNAILDPSCADITARVVEMLGTSSATGPDHPAIARALASTSGRPRRPKGCWYGRWGVNYIYGTWQVLQGLEGDRLPDGPSRRSIRACRWLESVQQDNGGLGRDLPELRRPHPTRGRGEPTPSQTPWGVLALVSAGRGATETSARPGGRSTSWAHQKADGTWVDLTYTGTGFTRVFYLRYHLYPVLFSVMAIARHHAAADRLPTTSTHSGALASRIPAMLWSPEV